MEKMDEGRCGGTGGLKKEMIGKSEAGEGEGK